MSAAAAGSSMQGIGAAAGTIGRINTATSQRKSLKVEAESIAQQAAFDEAQTRRQNRLAQGEANAIGAASGLDISSGSPLLHELDRIKQTEIEALNIRRAGQNKVNAINYQRRMLKRQIPFEAVGGLAQGGSILSSYSRR